MATLTTNKNFLSPVGFQFKINSDTYPNLEYFATSANLPDVSLNVNEQPFRGTTVKYTGEVLSFGDLTLRVNLLEDLENYIETFNWMHNIINNGSAEGFQEQGTLLILNSHNNVAKEVHFKGLFPTSLGGITFDAQGDFQYASSDITFAYTSFEFK
mgnify:FL=1|jgi:hypothetical protein|tara:strand:+ start:678 stop:1145 length:468 start_codon:yes stop_codon:yes gene_type:complete